METVDELIDEPEYILNDEHFVDKVASAARASSYELLGIWKELGIEGECLRERKRRLLQYQTGVISGMIEAEAKNCQRVREKIRLLEEEIIILRIELKVDENDLFSFNETNLALLQRQAYLKSVVENLLEQKDQKLGEFIKLLNEERMLCEVMSLRPRYSADSFDCHDIPSDKTIENLQRDIQDLKEEQEIRVNNLIQLRNQICKLIEELEESHSEMTRFQKELLYDHDKISLSDDKLRMADDWLKLLQERLKNNKIQIASFKKRLNSLWNHLEVDNADRELILSQYTSNASKTVEALGNLVEDLEDERRGKLGQCFDKVMNLLSEYWDKCMVSNAERQAFEDLVNGDYTEDNLELVEAEIKTRREFYETNAVIFSKIRKRLDLWDKMIDFEKKCQDKTRYHNRGGNLLKEEKERKTFLKSIPKLENELRNLVTEWEKGNKLRFIIFGVPVEEYFGNQWDEYQTDKNNIKTQRLQRIFSVTSSTCLSTPYNCKSGTTTLETKTLTPKTFNITPSTRNVFSR